MFQPSEFHGFFFQIFIGQIMEKMQFSWDTPNNQLKDHPLGPLRSFQAIKTMLASGYD